MNAWVDNNWPDVNWPEGPHSTDLSGDTSRVPWLRLYEAHDIQQAQMVVDLLVQQGIVAHIRGGFLQAGLGELPAAGLISVWIPETKFALAQEVIADFENGAIAQSDLVHKAQAILSKQGLTLPLCSDGESPYSVVIENSRYGANQTIEALVKQEMTRVTQLAWLYEADGQTAYPLVGDVLILLDEDAEPALLMRVDTVSRVNFAQVDEQTALAEGFSELRAWQEAKWKEFAADCQAVGRKPAPQMPLICLQISVLHDLRV